MWIMDSIFCVFTRYLSSKTANSWFWRVVGLVLHNLILEKGNNKTITKIKWTVNNSQIVMMYKLFYVLLCIIPIIVSKSKLTDLRIAFLINILSHQLMGKLINVDTPKQPKLLARTGGGIERGNFSYFYIKIYGSVILNLSSM